MRKTLVLLAICFTIAALAVALGVGNNNARSVGQASGETKEAKAESKSIVKLLQDARVSAFNSWSVDDGDLHYTVQAFDQDANNEEAGVKLSIFNEAGAVLHEDHFGEVQRIYPSYALRKAAPQLIVEASDGGNASFLKMLDYQDGKIVDLMEAVKPNNSFTVGAEVRPQLRAGVSSAKEPFQVLLTEGVGLASPAEKYTSVFRYKEGAYRYVGRFPTQEVDSYMEKLLTESGANKQRAAKLQGK